MTQTAKEALVIGGQARAVLENNAFRLVCEEVQANLTRAFKSGTDEEALEVRKEAQALEKVLSRLTRLAQVGDVARQDLEKENADEK